MSDTKILQLVLDKVTTVDKKIDEVKEEVKENGKRIDRLGLDLARLQDDAPTIEEFVNN
jgi:peptidoglycan hydrolase CwlO-like protein